MKTSTGNEKYFLSWEEFDNSVRWIESNFQPKGRSLILPVVRGGLALGSALSHRWKIQEVYPIIFQTRDNKNVDLSLISYIDLNRYTNVIIVEDLIDSGATYDGLMSILHDEFLVDEEKVKFVALLNKRKDRITNVIAPKSTLLDQWVVFPWEQRDECIS